MTTATNCELCAAPLGAQGHDRIGGLALCRRCFLGDVRPVLADRGWTLWSEHAEVVRSELEDRRAYVTQVRVTLAETGLAMVCRRATPWQRLLGFFRGRARSRDPLFEGHVRVWTRQVGEVEAFLAEEGVEGCVMEALGNLLSSQVEVRGGSLAVYYAADDPHTEGEVVARACVLAHHLERRGSRVRAADPEDARPTEASVYGAPRRG